VENLLPALALALFLFYIVTYWRGGLSLVKSLRESVSAPDRVVLIILTLLMILTIIHAFIAVITSADVLLPLPVWVVGIVLEIIGISGMFYSRSVLGKFWTAQTILRTDHQVVDSSVYGIVRHPIYTSAILTLLGLGLVFSTSIGLILMVLNIVGHFAKTALEDRYLGENLSGYADYQKRVRFKLIPGVW